MTRSLACALVLTLASSLSTVTAVSVRSWSASTADAFAEGTLDGTAIDVEGRVRLAPTAETIWGPEDGIVWDLDAAGAQGAFVGLSGPGRVLRVGREIEPELWFRAEEESLVTALAGDGGNGLYIGLSPAGRVLHASGPGAVTTVVETGSTFVWSLATDAEGALWIGTGLPGKLLRRAPDGSVRTVYETGDDPIRSLASLGAGVIALGTGGRGRVIRVNTEGEAFVLLDTEEAEVVALSGSDDGALFALTAAPKQPAGPRKAAQAAPGAVMERVTVTATPPPEEGAEPGEGHPQPRREEKRPASTFRSAVGGAVYRIDPDGGALELWRTKTEIPFDLELAEEDILLVATGDSGRIYTLDPTGKEALLLRIPSNHASAMARSEGKHLLVGGTTDARVVRVGPGARSSGTYLSPPVDARNVADWGRLTWDATVPRGARLALQVRSGNTAEPDATWSAWMPVRASSGMEGVVTGLPPARWFQARADLLSRQGTSPTLNRLEIFFRPRNRSPRITTLTVEPAGTVWAPGPTQSSNRLGPLVADDPAAREAVQRLRAGRRNGPIRKGYEAGARTFHWNATDPDGDRLSFTLDLRLEGAADWFPLAVGLDKSYHSWDARSLPDGLYRVRIRASDGRDNPDGSELTAEEVSNAFRVDNTRPAVAGLSVEAVAGGRRIAFVARDAGGSVAAVEVAMDGGPWRALDPLDGVADSEEERYELILDATDTRSLRVRVSDGSGNLGGELWLIDEP